MSISFDAPITKVDPNGVQHHEVSYNWIFNILPVSAQPSYEALPHQYADHMQKLLKDIETKNLDLPEYVYFTPPAWPTTYIGLLVSTFTQIFTMYKLHSNSMSYGSAPAIIFQLKSEDDWVLESLKKQHAAKLKAQLIKELEEESLAE